MTERQNNIGLPIPHRRRPAGSPVVFTPSSTRQPPRSRHPGERTRACNVLLSCGASWASAAAKGKQSLAENSASNNLSVVGRSCRVYEQGPRPSCYLSPRIRSALSPCSLSATDLCKPTASVCSRSDNLLVPGPSFPRRKYFFSVRGDFRKLCRWLGQPATFMLANYSGEKVVGHRAISKTKSYEQSRPRILIRPVNEWIWFSRELKTTFVRF